MTTDKKVRVINTTGIPVDTKIYIDGVELSKSYMASVNVRIRPDEIITATVELFVDDVDVVGELLR